MKGGIMATSSFFCTPVLSEDDFQRLLEILEETKPVEVKPKIDIHYATEEDFRKFAQIYEAKRARRFQNKSDKSL